MNLKKEIEKPTEEKLTVAINFSNLMINFWMVMAFFAVGIYFKFNDIVYIISSVFCATTSLVYFLAQKIDKARLEILRG